MQRDFSNVPNDRLMSEIQELQEKRKQALDQFIYLGQEVDLLLEEARRRNSPECCGKLMKFVSLLDEGGEIKTYLCHTCGRTVNR